MRWVVNAAPRPFYPREAAPVPVVQEAGGARAGLNGCGEKKMCCPTVLRTADGPARTEALYRVRYPGPCLQKNALPFFYGKSVCNFIQKQSAEFMVHTCVISVLPIRISPNYNQNSDPTRNE